MKTRQLICTALVAMPCLAGTASAKDSDRRGPNVMSAPQQVRNYSNNTNTYDSGDIQSRRGPNVMPMPKSHAQAPASPRTERTPAPADESTRAQSEPSARGSGPNIIGEPTGLAAPEDDQRDRRGVAI